MRRDSIKKLLGELNARLRHVRARQMSGVVTLPHDEFEEAARTWPRAKPGQHGVLLVPEQLSFDEWVARYSPGPPIHVDEKKTDSDTDKCHNRKR